ncbi:MAG: hypothetical protein ACP5KN_19435, partial [Armatimonadota bacterium]
LSAWHVLRRQVQVEQESAGPPPTVPPEGAIRVRRSSEEPVVLRRQDWAELMQQRPAHELGSAV